MLPQLHLSVQNEKGRNKDQFIQNRIKGKKEDDEKDKQM